MIPQVRRLTTTPHGLLFLGLLIRELLSFWTGHPYDLEVWIRNAYFVSGGANPYSAFMPPVPGLSFTYLQERLPGVGYLPLWPIIVAGLYRIYDLLPGASRFVLYFLLKQPPILGDVVLGFLMYRLIHRWGGKGELALHGLRFWMLFPYPILISAVWGQFDAIVAALFLAFLLSGRTARGYAAIGLGILLKWLPLIYLPYYVFREKGARKVFAVLALGVPVAFTVLVFGIFGWDYLGVSAMTQSASHGGGGGLTYVNILQAPLLLPTLSSISGLYYVLGFFWVPGVLLAGFVAHRRFSGDTAEATVQAILLITTVLFLTRWGVYEQYLIYLLPLFYIDVVLWHPSRKSLFLVTWILAFAFLLVNNDLLLRFLGPLDSRAVDIAYAFDNTSNLGMVRVWAMYAIEVLFTIHLVQLVLVFVKPLRDSTPWLLRPFARLRWVPEKSLSDAGGDP